MTSNKTGLRRSDLIGLERRDFDGPIRSDVVDLKLRRIQKGQEIRIV